MSAQPRPQSTSSSSEKKYSDEKIEHELGVDPIHLRHVNEVTGAKVVIEATNAEFAAAKLHANLNPLSRESFMLYGCAAMSFLCSCGNGYDGSLMTGINGMPYWRHMFNNGDSAPSTGIIFAIYTVGQMVGSLWADKVTDRYGRRAGMFVGCCVIVLGTIVISTATGQGQFIGGRFLLGMGIGVATVAAPTYCIEISPPQWRGRMTALYNTGWSGGAIPAAAIVFGTQSMKNNWSWRLPLVLQCVPAGLVICLVWFFPESPRWLFMHDREREAHDFLIKFHGNNDPENPIVKLELEEFREHIMLDASDKRWWDYSALYKTKSARWRFGMVFTMGLFGQMSGNGLGYYNLSIYQSLGFDTYMQFAMNLIGACTSAIMSWVAVSLSDRMPRRKVLVIGTFICSVMLAANAGLSAKWASYGTGPKDLTIGRLGATFFFLFGVVYAFTYTPLQSLYPAECLETTARAKGISMKIFVIACTSFINLYCIPIGLKNIGWRFMLVYVFWDLFESVVWYLVCVETLGRTLEELEEVFNSPNPVAASKMKRKIAVVGDGDVVVVDDRSSA